MVHRSRLRVSVLVLAPAFFAGCGPSEPPRPTAEQQRQQARFERGRYLVEGLFDCFGCHSEVDWKSPEASILPGRKGSGTVFPGEVVPFPIVAPNITPDAETGVGKWSDEELGKAIRNGIGHDGRVLFPMMPYTGYRSMSDEDLAGVIAYVRSVPPVRNAIARIELPPPVKQSLQAPPPVTSVAEPDVSSPVKRGAYLVTIAACADCHTPLDKEMRPRTDLAFGGGFVLKGPWGEVAAPNLTPDASGISYYDEAVFVHALRMGRVQARKLNPIMPWPRHRGLRDEDLKAMFAFLQTLKPVAHRVDNTEPRTKCRKCGYTHGLGSSN